MPTFSWCTFVLRSKKNVYDRLLLEVMKKTAPDFTRKCPYVGNYKIVNAKAGRQFMQLFDEGVYRYDIVVSDSNSTGILFGSVFLQVED